MRDPLSVTVTAFTPAQPELRATGLLGFIRLVLNDTVVVDELSLRRTRDGRLVISWPEPRSRGGARRVVHPRNEDSRLYLEGQVLSILRRRGVIP